MPLSADCENCFQPYPNLPDNAAGKTFKCKVCGHPVAVGRAGTAPAASLPPAPAAPRASKGGGQKQRSPAGKKRADDASSGSNPLAVIGITVGGIACLLVAWALIYPLIRNAQLKEELAALEAEEQVETGDVATNSEATSPVNVATPADSASSGAAHGADTSAMVAASNPDTSEGETPASTVEVVQQNQPAGGNDSPPAATVDPERKRPALIEAFNRQESTKYIATLIEGMDRDDLAKLDGQLPMTMPLNISTALMMVPCGFDLNDDNALIERQKLVVKQFNKKPRATAFAGPVERMTIDQYREWERQMCGPQLEAMRDALTRPVTGIAGLKREQITFNENGYQLPDGIRQRVLEAVRRQVDSELTRAEKTNTDYGELPFWAPLEITKPAEETAWDASFKTNPAIPNDPNKYVTSTIPGPFIAGGLTGFNSGQLKAFNILTGQPAGELAVPVEQGDVLLSPDGRLVVIEKTKPGVGKEYPVYSFETGQLLHTITSPTAFVVSWSGIVAPDRLVTFESAESTSSEPAMIRVYDLTTGKQLRQFDYTGVVFDKMTAVSPDGRYIARLTHGFEIDLFDLEAGRPIAQKKLDRTPSLTLETIAFSNAGDKLAVMGRHIYERTFLLIIDTKNGQTLKQFWLPGDFEHYVANHASYRGRDLAWFPDDSALWLGGGSVVDVERETELLRYDAKSAHPTIDSFVCNGPRIPVNNGVVVVDGYEQGNLGFLPVDFEALRATADAEPDSLLLAHGDDVAIDVAFKGVDIPDGGEEALKAGLTAGLEAYGFTVVEEAPVTFRLSPGKANKRAGSAVPTSWTFEIAWINTESKKELWSGTARAALLSAAASAANSGGSTSAIETVARQLTKQIKEAGVPTTISDDGKTVLPSLQQLASPGKRRSR